MAQDSKRKRYIRRIKRERTLALLIADQMVKERNYYRAVLGQVYEKAKQNENKEAAPYTESQRFQSDAPNV